MTQYSDPVLVQSVKSLSPTNTIPQKLARMDSALPNLIISTPVAAYGSFVEGCASYHVFPSQNFRTCQPSDVSEVPRL